MDTSLPPPPSPDTVYTMYTHLKAVGEIRLLLLQPLDSDGNVVCTLEHAELSSKSQYESLSYCWGVTTTETIFIHGQDVQVRTNLWAALKQLSPTEGTRYLWTDALCINQGDLDERSKQVAQMGKIYGQATGVLVWLGPESVDSPLAFQLLIAPSAWPKLWKSTDEILRETAVESQLQAFENLCEREYWHRLWIVQEIFLAQKIAICCGANSTTWLRLSWFLCSFPNPSELKTVKIDLPPILESFSQAIKSSIPWRFFSHHRRTSAKGLNSISITPKAAFPAPSLHHLCIEYGQARCADPRDKIYGLHALAAECCKNKIVIDYTIPEWRIWTKLLQHLVFVRHTLGAYEGTEGLVRDVQLLHKTLNIGAKAFREYIQPLIDAQISSTEEPKKKEDPLIMEGRVRGLITYLSPPLSQSSVSEVSKNFPKFTSWNAEEIEYIYKSLSEVQNQQHKFIATSFDLVRPITTSRTSGPRTAAYGFASTQKYLDFSTIWNATQSVSSQEELSLRFTAILKAAYASVPSTYAPYIRLAIEQNGMICFVPATTQINDMILQFRNSAVLAIVRTETDTDTHASLSPIASASNSTPANSATNSITASPSKIRFRLVGRAVNFVNAEDTMLYDVLGTDFSAQWPKLNGRRMDLEGDYVALRDLTISSELIDVIDSKGLVMFDMRVPEEASELDIDDWWCCLWAYLFLFLFGCLYLGVIDS